MNSYSQQLQDIQNGLVQGQNQQPAISVDLINDAYNSWATTAGTSSINAGPYTGFSSTYVDPEKEKMKEDIREIKEMLAELLKEKIALKKLKQ